MVDIYLWLDDHHLAHFLSIPHYEIQHLSVRPFKWLRFVIFSVCGARGQLFSTPDCLVPVDYDTHVTAFVDGDTYYYKSLEDCIFVGQHGLSDRITSSVQTPRRHNFRSSIIRRDGSCVVTQDPMVVCDAAHLIPRSKGNEYIGKVVHARSPRYPPMVLDRLCDIDAVENGVLLTKTLHVWLGLGQVAFLQTPNFAMEPDDIPRSELGPTPDSRVTLQRFEKPADFNVHQRIARYNSDFNSGREWPKASVRLAEGVDVDAQIGQESRPPPIILDFFYGIAAYRRWKSGPAQIVMDDYYSKHFKSIPVTFRPPSPSANSSTDERDDPRDPDHARESRRHGRGTGQTMTMADAMDEVNLVLMLLSGITPEESAARWEKRMEEEEKIKQEESRNKVAEWIQGTHADS